MSLLFTSQNPSLLSTTTTTITTATFRHSSATFRHSSTTSLPYLLHPKRIKSPPIRVSSNKPPSSPGWNSSDQTLNDDEESDGIQLPTVTDEWGEKSEPENEPLTKLPASDPPQNEDEWGTGNRNVTTEPIKDEGYGSGSTVVEDDGKLQELKRCLVDSVYGTGLGFKASQEERAEIIESTPAPTDAVELLDGNWVLFTRNRKPAKMAHAQQYSTVFTLSPLKLPNVHTKTPSSSIRMRFSKIRSGISIKEHPFPPNAMTRKIDSRWMGGFSLGIDLGLSRTGIALSKGFSIRPLKVLELRGQKLEMSLLQIAQQQEVDEFIIGLPISSDGKETPQSNKVRSVAGRIAIQAAERGWRVYLQNEHGTSTDAMNRMIDLGLNKSARKESLDAYAAMMVLERYFSESGQGAEMVLPKQLDLQEKIRKGPPTDEDFDFF